MLCCGCMSNVIKQPKNVNVCSQIPNKFTWPEALEFPVVSVCPVVSVYVSEVLFTWFQMCALPNWYFILNYGLFTRIGAVDNIAFDIEKRLKTIKKQQPSTWLALALAPQLNFNYISTVCQQSQPEIDQWCKLNIHLSQPNLSKNIAKI